ncbi:MAG: porin family protein [Acidobacteriota bacterium]|nr:porin family protein [Acidobacteriota bacterium]
MFKRLFLLIGLCSATAAAHGQALPTASRLGDLSLGAGYTTVNSDYSPQRYTGFGIYGDFNYRPHWGAEAEFRFASDHQSSQFYEKTYELGPRYYLVHGRYTPYAKAMYGRGVFNFYQGQANLAYNMLVGGAGLDYRIMPWLSVRGDFEYQHWFGFPPNGLTPTTLTFGAAYHFR